MADNKLRNRPLTKGMKLPILIEEAIEDVIIACLTHGSRQYRGVLLDINKGNLPHGVTWPDCQKGRRSEAKVEDAPVVKTENPATTLRHKPGNGQDCHSVLNDENHLSRKPPIRFLKDKTVRNIRLRPRQTLCSNCKAACLNTAEGPVPVQNVAKSETPVNKTQNAANTRVSAGRVVQNNACSKIQKPSKPTMASGVHTSRSLGISLRSCGSITKNSFQKPNSPSRTAIRNHLRKRKTLQSPPLLVPQIKIPKVDSTESRPRCMRWNLRNSNSPPELVDVRSVMSKKSAVEKKKADDSEDVQQVSTDTCKRSKSVESDNQITDKTDVKCSSSVSDLNVNSITANESTPTILSHEEVSSGLKTVKADVPTESKTLKNEKIGNLGHKSSPMIKISIGEKTVLKIPPRAHVPEGEMSGTEYSSDEKIVTESTDNKNVQAGSLLGELERVSEEEENCVLSDQQATDIIHESSQIDKSQDVHNFHHKKHKRKHKRKKYIHENSSFKLLKGDRFETNVNNADNEDNDEENDEPDDINAEVLTHRPRLLYTWRHNKGLSPRRDPIDVKALSPRREPNNSNRPYNRLDSVKDKKFQIIFQNNDGNEKSFIETSDDMKSNDPSSDASFHSTGSNFQDNSHFSDSNSDSDGSGDTYTEPPPSNSPEHGVDGLQPLTLTVHTKDVTSCGTQDGRRIHIGDIVWGKIHGFPWWPGRVLSISVSQKDNGAVIRQLSHVSWFGSSTMSYLKCSDVCPFLENFKLRYNKKKQGPYKMAIKLATIAAQRINSSFDIDMNSIDL